MNDLSKAREHLLQDYIKEFDPSQKEMDAFMRGVTWMMDYVTDDNNLSPYIPDKVCLHRQQRNIEELMDDFGRKESLEKGRGGSTIGLVGY